MPMRPLGSTCGTAVLAALLLVLAGLAAAPGARAQAPPPPPACSNGIDDDGDGLIDMMDPGCTDPLSDNGEADPPPPAACSNGVDDDGDGLVDLDDPGCKNKDDDSETDAATTACSNGIDDDGDGLVDLKDTGCTSAADDSETDPAPAAACSNGRDDDGDGQVDGPDPGCDGPGDNDETDPAHAPPSDDEPPVKNRPPVASFEVAPRAPVAGTRVRFTSTAVDPDGRIAALAWDLNADGRFGEATATVAARRFSRPGSYVVRLRATDGAGARALAERTVVVAETPAMSPSPVVRLAGRFSRRGVTVSVLSVDAPRGARIVVRCRGRGCPARSVAGTAQLRRFHRFERRLPVGVRLEIRVTKPAVLGRFTSFRIRRARPPVRRDRCLRPGSSRPVSCPP
jgi:hypothetical protein